MVKRQKVFFFETNKVGRSFWKEPNKRFLPFFFNQKGDKIKGNFKVVLEKTHENPVITSP